MSFWNLFKKETRSIFPAYGVFAIAVVVLHVVVLYNRGALSEDAIFGLSLIMPGLAAVVLGLGTGYFQLHSEWRTNSIYLLLSLPVRGWKVLLAKLLSVLMLLYALVLWIGISFSLLLLPSQWRGLMENEELKAFLPVLVSIIGHMLWISTLAVVFLLVLVQFTYLCGQLVAKLKWLVMFVSFFGMLWLVLRISPLLSGLLTWTPDIVIGEVGIDAAYLHSGPFLVLLLLSIGLLALNGYIFEKEVEV